MVSNKELTEEQFAISFRIKRHINDLLALINEVETTYDICTNDDVACTIDVVTTGLQNVRYDLINALRDNENSC